MAERLKALVSTLRVLRNARAGGDRQAVLQGGMMRVTIRFDSFKGLKAWVHRINQAAPAIARFCKVIQEADVR
jgi:hypothetical protein